MMRSALDTESQTLIFARVWLSENIAWVTKYSYWDLIRYSDCRYVDSILSQMFLQSCNLRSPNRQRELK